jgi:prepilin-type N-terminal cleavage/methylation domain-containing protein
LLARSRLRQGFTLIEAMVAVTILAILVALSAYGLRFFGTARMNNAVFDVAAIINTTQLRAISRGAPHYVFIHQPLQNTTQPGRVRILMIERPDSPRLSRAEWAALNLVNGPAAALTFTDPLGTPVNAAVRDRVTLGTSWTEPGNQPPANASYLGFLDLDSNRIRKPLPAPFTALSLSTTVQAPNLNIPVQDLMAGCNFCINPSGTEPYGALRFNADGTMEVMTGNARSGAVIAFAPNTRNEADVLPKILAVSAPAGAVVIF